MADIVIIPNQPILFRNTDEISNCVPCNEQPYCQIVYETDATQFQIKSNDIVVNGDFEEEDEGWITPIGLTLEAIVTNVTGEGECDGSVSFNVYGGGAGVYYYSINGGTPQTDEVFTGLCAGCYYANVHYGTPDGVIEGSIEFCISTSQCDAGDNTIDLLPYNTIDFLNCNTLDFL